MNCAWEIELNAISKSIFSARKCFLLNNNYQGFSLHKFNGKLEETFLKQKWECVPMSLNISQQNLQPWECTKCEGIQKLQTYKLPLISEMKFLQGSARRGILFS